MSLTIKQVITNYIIVNSQEEWKAYRTKLNTESPLGIYRIPDYNKNPKQFPAAVVFINYCEHDNCYIPSFWYDFEESK